MAQMVISNADAHAIVRRGVVTNVNDGVALPFLHSSPVALSDAWNKFDGYASQCGSGAWFLHLEHTATAPDYLASAARWLPSIMDRLNNSRRMRRLGVTGARLANVYKRGGTYLYVSDSVFADWYACAVVAFSVVQKAMPSATTQRLVVRLRRSAYGRRSMHDCVGAFMRSFWDKSKYHRSHVTLDPIGNWEVQITTESGLSMGLLALLMDLFADAVDFIEVGRKVTISRESTLYESDYMETIAKPFRSFRFRYLQTFGDFSPNCKKE